jgi:hypothetical protein
MDRSPSRIASWLSSWRPFLTGVALGLALLAAVGAAIAQSVDATPFDALLKANVRNGVVSYSGFQDNAAFHAYLERRLHRRRRQHAKVHRGLRRRSASRAGFVDG